MCTESWYNATRIDRVGPWRVSEALQTGGAYVREREDPQRFPIHERVLDNGLRVIVAPDRRAPVVAVHVMYHVGSRFEPPGKTGFAHLFEHLLFQGSQHVDGTEHIRYVQGAGGTMNGTTWFDRTNYFEVLPSNRLDLALWLESDRMGFFLPAISQAKLDNQRDVVKNERRQSYENRPYGLATETVLRELFPPGHPYRHPTIGSMADLDAATLDDVVEFFRSWYGPPNATLVIAGDVGVDDALSRAEHWFGDLRGDPPPSPPFVPSRTAAMHRAVLEDEVSVPRIYWACSAPAFAEPGYEAADVLTSLLAEGKSSRLYSDLVYERELAADVTSFVWPTEEAGMAWIVATARPDVEAARLEEGVRAVVAGLQASGPDEDELLGARRRARRQLVQRVDSVGARADLIAHAAVYRDDPGYVNQVFDRFAAVHADDVAKAGAGLFAPTDGAIVHVVPRGES